MCLVFAVLLIYVFQRQLIYFPTPDKPKQSNFAALDLVQINITTKDNLLLNAWYKKAKYKSATVLFLHGNAGNIGHRMPTARQLINAGFGVLLLEYRGYGGNEGTPSETGLYKDGHAALNYISKQGVSSSQLVLFGESIGTGVATKLATETSSCALILQSPFTSLASIAGQHYPWLPLSPWDKFDSLSRMSLIKTPVLILHGTQDTLVPFKEGAELFSAANHPKKMISFSGFGHNNLAEAKNFYPEIIEFIKQHCN